jgi:hypothetical protein
MTREKDSGRPDCGAELLTAFRCYCETGTAPAVSPYAMGYVRHCLGKAARNAAILGEEVNIYHHPMFALWDIETGQGDRIADFLMALPRVETP